MGHGRVIAGPFCVIDSFWDHFTRWRRIGIVYISRQLKGMCSILNFGYKLVSFISSSIVGTGAVSFG